MSVQFDSAVASAGGYDQLVDLLRNTFRQAQAENAPPQRIEEIKTLLDAVSLRIEQAALSAPNDAPAATGNLPQAPLQPMPDLDELVRRLSSSLSS